MRKTKTVQSFPTDNIKDYGEGIRLNPFFLCFGGDNNEAWCSSDCNGKTRKSHVSIRRNHRCSKE